MSFDAVAWVDINKRGYSISYTACKLINPTFDTNRHSKVIHGGKFKISRQVFEDVVQKLSVKTMSFKDMLSIDEIRAEFYAYESFIRLLDIYKDSTDFIVKWNR